MSIENCWSLHATGNYLWLWKAATLNVPKRMTLFFDDSWIKRCLTEIKFYSYFISFIKKTEIDILLMCKVQQIVSFEVRISNNVLIVRWNSKVESDLFVWFPASLNIYTNPFTYFNWQHEFIFSLTFYQLWKESDGRVRPFNSQMSRYNSGKIFESKMDGEKFWFFLGSLLLEHF